MYLTWQIDLNSLQAKLNQLLSSWSDIAIESLKQEILYWQISTSIELFIFLITIIFLAFILYKLKKIILSTTNELYNNLYISIFITLLIILFFIIWLTINSLFELTEWLISPNIALLKDLNLIH